MFSLTVASVSFAGEADYFTNRYPLASGQALLKKPNKLSYLYTTEVMKSADPEKIVKNMADLPDVAAAMNKKMDEELDRASAKVQSCSVKDLHQSVLDNMGGFLIAEIEIWGSSVPELKSYGPFNPFNEYGTVYSDVKVSGCCANIMKINGSLVSLDKLGHFISHGYEYFEISERQGSQLPDLMDSRMNTTSIPFSIGLKGEKGALEFGHRQEAGFWGISSSGVYSYGDLAANYDGFRFWKNLTKGPTPYLRCENGHWKRVRNFKWSEYVSDGWDEGINCNSYANQEIEKGVAARVLELQTASGKNVKDCPVEPDKCKDLLQKYSDVKNRVLSPKCIAAASLKVEKVDSKKATSERVGER